MKSSSAFSLVELSIVLVILGLLTGGILAGQNLIRASELRSVTTEFNAYQTAVHTFRDKYFALPGDFRDATKFWGAATCPGTAGTGTQTCDGNGDGVIDVPGAATQYGERFTFWQHLANAGLIEGSYTGMAGTGHPQNADIGENVPRADLSNAGWATQHNAQGNVCNAGQRYTGAGISALHNRLRIGFENGVFLSGPTFTPEEGWNIDTKIDDGKPGQGKLIGYCATECSDVIDTGDAEYALQTTARSCFLDFRFE